MAATPFRLKAEGGAAEPYQIVAEPDDEISLIAGSRAGTVPAVAEDSPRRRWWQRVWDARVDLSPLRTRDFRLLFGAATAGYLGSMVGYVAVPFQIFRITGSNLAVGIVGGIELVPLIVFGLWGGALADRFDRRMIMVVTGALTTVLSVALLVNALLDHPRVWVIYLIAGLLAMSSSLQRPSQDALVPRTVRHDQLTAAVAAWSLAWQLGSLLGPAIGGVLIARFGVAIGYAIWAGLALVTVAVLVRLGPYPPAERTTDSGLRSIGTGLRYAAGRRDLLGTYIVDLVGMFMAMPTVLFPAFGIHVFGHPGLVGLLYASEGLGSALATVTSGWMSRVHRHGRAITLAAICWGAAIGLAGLAPWYWLAFGLLIAAGAFDQISGTFRMVLWNQTIPTSCAAGSPASKCCPTRSVRWAANSAPVWSRTWLGSGRQLRPVVRSACSASQRPQRRCAASGVTTVAPTRTLSWSGSAARRLRDTRVVSLSKDRSSGSGPFDKLGERAVDRLVGEGLHRGGVL